MAATETETTVRTATVPKARARLRFNQAMRLVRRAHLYAGLFMTPWVFLYGATALLFNHPRAFPDQEIRAITPADLAGTPLMGFPRPQSLAGRVVDAINSTSEGRDSGPTDRLVRPDYRLVRPEVARFAREYFTTVTGDGQDHQVRLDLVSGTGTVRSSPRRKEAEPEIPPPFARRGLIRLDPPPMEAVTKGLPVVLTRLGLPTRTVPNPTGPDEGPAEGRAERRGRSREGDPRGTGTEERPGGRGGGVVGPGGTRGPGAAQGRLGAGPELNFLMEGQGKVWRVGYNLQTGALTGRPADAGRAGDPLSTRRFLTRLHMAHGYPSQFDARWVWAVAVDLMFVSMVGWGITGLLMWWQMKNVRRSGVVLLALSAVVSTAVAIGMHSSMVGGP